MPRRGSLFVFLTFALSCAPAGNTDMPDSAADSASARAEPAKLPRFLALGDSYTIGESVKEEDRWPMQLARELRAIGTAVDNPVIIAKTGWTTDELDAAITEAKPDTSFALVTLLIGVNDQYRAREADSYRAPFRKLLKRAIGFAGGEANRVIVVSIPDWGATPFAAGRDAASIATAIDRFNAINREEATAAGARYVDITPASRKARGDTSLTAGDGLHPSAKMYRSWTDSLLPVANTILRGTR